MNKVHTRADHEVHYLSYIYIYIYTGLSQDTDTSHEAPTLPRLD